MSPARYVRGPSGFVELGGGVAAPAWFSIASSWRVSATNADLNAVSFTPNATAHTLGAWVELSASLPVDADALEVGVLNSAANVNKALMFDIGTGPAGSEVALVSDVPIHEGSSSQPGTTVVPVKVNAGTRVAIRFRSARASNTGGTAAMQVLQLPSALSSWMPSDVDVLGSTPSATRGVSLTSSGTWVQVVASTSRAYKAVALAINSLDATMAGSVVAFDLGVGPSGSEVAHLGGQYLNNNAETLFYNGGPRMFVLDVPAGTRLAVRYVDDDLSNLSYSCSLIGVPA